MEPHRPACQGGHEPRERACACKEACTACRWPVAPATGALHSNNGCEIGVAAARPVRMLRPVTYSSCCCPAVCGSACGLTHVAAGGAAPKCAGTWLASRRLPCIDDRPLTQQGARAGPEAGPAREREAADQAPCVLATPPLQQKPVTTHRGCCAQDTDMTEAPAAGGSPAAVVPPPAPGSAKGAADAAAPAAEASGAPGVAVAANSG